MLYHNWLFHSPVQLVVLAEKTIWKAGRRARQQQQQLWTPALRKGCAAPIFTNTSKQANASMCSPAVSDVSNKNEFASKDFRIWSKLWKWQLCQILKLIFFSFVLICDSVGYYFTAVRWLSGQYCASQHDFLGLILCWDRAFLCGVCMFSPCLHGLSAGVPVSPTI